jgi:hypothetical protein
MTIERNSKTKRTPAKKESMSQNIPMVKKVGAAK